MRLSSLRLPLQFRFALLLLVATASALRTPAAAPRGRGRGVAGRGRAIAITRRGQQNIDWFEKRRDGVRSATKSARRSRTRKAESGGDALYADVSIDPTVAFRGLSGAALEEAAERLLAEAGAPPAQAAAVPTITSTVPDDSPVMWGGCPVGPVLKARLLAANLSAPLAVQRAAFAPVSQGRSALIWSETGSGKTLAFVLPLLSTMKKGTPAQVLAICPSADLALQLRRVVDSLWPPEEAWSTGADPASAVHVLPAGDDGDDDAALLAPLATAPIVAGTPHAVRRLLEAAAAARRQELAASQTRGAGGGDDGRRRRGGGGRGGAAAQPARPRARRGGSAAQVGRRRAAGGGARGAARRQ